MSVFRINEFRARDGEADALRELLDSVVPQIRSAPGCRSCRLLRAEGEPTRLVVLEEWDSIDAHRASVGRIPAAQLEQARSLIAEPPRGDYFVT